ncbi:hypothetical protein AKJ09_10767 [Labilithrix luteola]|uniref:Uncharacterized protein n=1 Tax=Labilithrix luteola TaxID=1391654 RepID=A0A0K1QEB6_9BACT|nr:hypothetical protein AKJ09_10767 [Labilithrix luteola]
MCLCTAAPTGGNFWSLPRPSEPPGQRIAQPRGPSPAPRNVVSVGSFRREARTSGSWGEVQHANVDRRCVDHWLDDDFCRIGGLSRRDRRRRVGPSDPACRRRVPERECLVRTRADARFLGGGPGERRDTSCARRRDAHFAGAPPSTRSPAGLLERTLRHPRRGRRPRASRSLESSPSARASASSGGVSNAGCHAARAGYGPRS